MLVVALGALAACAPATEIAVSSATDQSARRSFKRIVVLVENASPSQARDIERNLAAGLQALGVNARPGHEVIQSGMSSEEKGSRIIATGAEAVLYFVLEKMETQGAGPPGSFYREGQIRFGGFGNQTKMIYARLELQEIPSGKRVWEAQSEAGESGNGATFERVFEKMRDELVAKMRRDGVI